MAKTTEHQEQCAFFKYVRERAQYEPLYELIVAVPNAGKRSPRHGARMKAEGLSPGFPDIVAFIPRVGKDGSLLYAGLMIELKNPPSKPRENQLQWLERLTKAGYYTTVAYSADEAIKKLDKYMAIGRAS